MTSSDEPERDKRRELPIREGMPASDPESRDAVARLRGLHREIWDGIDPDAYVQRERSAWSDASRDATSPELHEADDDEDAAWAALTAFQVAQGYAEEDALYDLGSVGNDARQRA